MSILLLIAALLGVQKAELPASTRPAISVTISPSSDVVKLGSELRIKIVITNISNRELDVGRPVGNGPQGEFRNLIDVRDERGNAAVKTKYYRQIRGEEVTHGGIRLETTDSLLKPGESTAEEVVVSKLYSLEKEGKYTVQTQRDDPDSKALVKSNRITVTVTP